MSKKDKGGTTTGKDVKLLQIPLDKSPASVMNQLREAITYARHHRVKSAFIAMVLEPTTDREHQAYIKAICHSTHADIDELLMAIEEGHEKVFALGKD